MIDNNDLHEHLQQLTPQTKGKYQYRWAIDKEDRLEYLEERGWELCPDGPLGECRISPTSDIKMKRMRMLSSKWEKERAKRQEELLQTGNETDD